MSRGAGRAAAPGTSRWILSPLGDLVLFVATPLLILPAVAAAGRFATTATIYLVVASLGAIGHHLPGMLRAYGDSALLARFRTRFIVAPLFLLLACVPLAFVAKSALVLVVFAWGAWHGFMQAHGFARIYDARAGGSGRLVAWLDVSLLGSWFVAALVHSPARLFHLVDHFYKAGGAELPGGLIAAARLATLGLALILTSAHVLATLAAWRRGAVPSLPKLLLLGSTITFFWHANVQVADPLLAVVLFEIFHDVQYLAIVWLFNRRRVAADPAVGAFTRFLFRPRTLLLVLYVLLVFLYGGLNLIQDALQEGVLANLMAGLLAASALLHFYYDGFIWKLRRPETREGLGLAPAGSSAGPTGPSSAAFVAPAPLRAAAWHGLRWAVLFVLPVGALAAAALRPARTEAARQFLLARTFPDDPGAWRNVAVAEAQSGDLEAALVAVRKAESLSAGADPATRAAVRSTRLELLQARVLAELDRGHGASAVPLLVEALGLDPAAADPLVTRAADLIDRSELGLAEAACRTVLQAAPAHGMATCNLAVALAGQGRLGEARAAARRCGQLLPGDPRAATIASRLEEALVAAEPR